MKVIRCGLEYEAHQVHRYHPTSTSLGVNGSHFAVNPGDWIIHDPVLDYRFVLPDHLFRQRFEVPGEVLM